MNEQDLIKRMEKVSFSGIENHSHKEKLRNELLENYSQAKNRWEVFTVFKKLSFAAFNIVIFISFLSYIIIPQYSLAKTEKIVSADPQIKAIMEEENISSEIKIIDGKSYVLISSTEEGDLIKFGQEELAGVLLEVNLKEKRIEKINKIAPQISLNDEERERVEEIIKTDPEIKNNIPDEAKILEIKSISSQLEMVKKGKEIEVLPKDKKATVIYELDEKKWEGRVNIIEKKVEKIDFSIEEKKESTTTEQKGESIEGLTNSLEHSATTEQEDSESEKEKTSPNSPAMPERLELK